MRREDLLKLPSMPAAGPSYPAGLYRFVDREFLVITYETDPGLIRAGLPEPLEPIDRPIVHYEWIKMPDSSGFGSYTESGLVIPARLCGEEVNFVSQMYLDDDPPIAAGREIWGFPKKYAHLKLEIVKDTLTGTLEYAGQLVAMGTMGYKHESMAGNGDLTLATLSKTQINLKMIPGVDGRLEVCQLVKINLTDIVVKGSWIGPGRLHLVPHVNAPVADFPVRRVVGAHHFLADLTLPFGRVVHDYNKEAGRPTRPASLRNSPATTLNCNKISIESSRAMGDGDRWWFAGGSRLAAAFAGLTLAEPAKKSGAPLPDANPAIPGLVWAFRLHGDGSAEPLPIEAPIEFSHDGRLWLHFNLADARVRAWLAAVPVPQLARELLLSHDNFQQLHTIDNCVYGVFSDLVRAIDDVTEETGFLRFAMTERFLISGRHQALCAVDATRRVLEGGHRVETVAALLEKIIDKVADTMDRVADRIGAEIDGIEERILAGEIKSEMRGALGRSRRTSVRLHRQLAGLRTLFHRLEQKDPDHLSPALRMQAGKLAQRLDGLDHDIVELRERSRLLEEEIRFKMEEESNRHLHTLSVVTTLLLPPTLVTGIFGMNTKGLPLTDDETGFLWAAAIMIGAAGLAYLIMRRLGIVR